MVHFLAHDPDRAAEQQELERFLGDRPDFAILTGKELIPHYETLIRGVAERYANHGLTVDELVAPGQEGIMTAAVKFNKNEGPFKPYARLWVRQKIRRFMETGAQRRDIRIPGNALEQLSKMDKVIKEYLREHNRQPTPQEICKKLKINKERLEELIQAQRQARESNLEDPIPGTEGFKLKDTLQHEGASPLDIMEAQEVDRRRKQILGKMMRVLKPQQKKVLELTEGLKGEKHSYRRAGEKMDLSHERIGQIRKKALAELKAAFEKRGLKFSDL